MSTRKPTRPGLSTEREQILVTGLPVEPSAAAAAAPQQVPPPPPPYPGVRGYGQARPAANRGTAKRADPPGMKRESYYVTRAAADAIEAAVQQVKVTLGSSDVPKQVILSALLQAGAERAGEVAARIATDQANELTARLEALRRTTG